MLKRLSVIAALSLFLLLFLGSLFIYLFGFNPPILMYHEIQKEGSDTSKLIVAPEHFKRHMKYLNDQNYSVVDLETLFTWILSGKPIPSKTLAITFDDGYLNNYTEAFPILKQYGFPATIFLTVQNIGRHKDYLTWQQVREMEQHGIQFGNHTLTHPHLTRLPYETIKTEILKAQDILGQNVRTPSSIFCYPFGEFDSRIQRAVRLSGYRGAVASSPTGLTPLDDRYGFRRIRISNSSNSLYVFSFEIGGYYGFIGHMKKKLKRLRMRLFE